MPHTSLHAPLEAWASATNRSLPSLGACTGKPAVSMVSAARGSIDLVAVMAAQRPPSDLTEEEQMEMDMLDAFYRQLCRFAYAIKALDPICMALIYEVKG